MDFSHEFFNERMIQIYAIRKKIHTYGASKSAEELAVDITGEKLNPEYFKKYLENKYKRIYNL